MIIINLTENNYLRPPLFKWESLFFNEVNVSLDFFPPYKLIRRVCCFHPQFSLACVANIVMPSRQLYPPLFSLLTELQHGQG